MDLLRRHKVKLAAACLILGVISLARSQSTYCEDAEGAEIDCQVGRGQPGMRIVGGEVSALDLALGVVLVLAAPATLILVRRPY